MINHLFSPVIVEEVEHAEVNLKGIYPTSDDIYFQLQNPIEESFYNYLYSSQLISDLLQKADEIDAEQTQLVLHRVLEVGFGTGLNFLITNQALNLLTSLKDSPLN